MSKGSRNLISITIVALIAAGLGLAMFTSNVRATETANQRAATVLIDSAREQAATLRATLDGQLQVLQSTAAALSAYGGADSATFLSRIAADSSFDMLNFVSTDGYAALSDRLNHVCVADRSYFKRAMAGERAVQSVRDVYSRRYALVLAVPVYRYGTVCGVLRGVFYETSIRSWLTAQAYGGDGYSVLVNGAGRVVIGANESDQLVVGQDLFYFWKRVVFPRGAAPEKWDAAMRENGYFKTNYTYAGHEYIAVLVPVESDGLLDSDHYVYNVVPRDSFQEEIKEANRDSREIMMIYFTFTGIALLLYLRLEYEARLALRAEAEQTRMREERYRIVVEESGLELFEYDIPNRKFRKDARTKGPFGDMVDSEQTLESVLAMNIIAPESEEDYRELFRHIDAGESPVSTDIRLLHADGSHHWYHYHARTLFADDKTPKTAIVSYSECTEQRELAARAEKDPLTGLLNRAAFTQRFEECIRREPKQMHALLMLDVDAFKQINDACGHDEGDVVLRLLADTLRAQLREADLVGRMGGDEFVALLCSVHSEKSVRNKMAQLNEAVRASGRMTISIGGALYPRDGTTLETLYPRADAALYYVKKHGRNGNALCDDSMQPGSKTHGDKAGE